MTKFSNTLENIPQIFNIKKLGEKKRKKRKKKEKEKENLF
jgi:hypothetical protein